MVIMIACSTNDFNVPEDYISCLLQNWNTYSVINGTEDYNTRASNWLTTNSASNTSDWISGKYILLDINIKMESNASV
jgi:hypothetical protein